MKVFLLAVLGALVVAALGGWLLTSVQTTSWAKFSTESVRLGDAGHNLLIDADLQRRASSARRAGGD